MLNYLVKYANKGANLLKPLLKFLENPLIMGTVTIILVLYGALAKPELPNFLKNFMKNDLFRLFYIFLISYTGDKNLIVAIVISFTFMVLFGLLSEFEVQESFENAKEGGDLTSNLTNQLNTLLDELQDVTKGSAEMAESNQSEEE